MLAKGEPQDPTASITLKCKSLSLRAAGSVWAGSKLSAEQGLRGIYTQLPPLFSSQGSIYSQKFFRGRHTK